MTTITIPPFVGARATAQDLFTDVEPYDTLVLDFENTFNAAQGFLDEVVKLLIERHALNAQVIGTNERTEKLMKDAQRRRGYRSDGLFFVADWEGVHERCADMTNSHRCVLPASHTDNPLLMHSIDFSEPT